MRRRLDIAYLGGAFEGWQVQGSRCGGVPPRTVQGVLEEALGHVLGRAARVHGASRTDSGVHADGQVAHLDGDPDDPPIPSRGFVLALNARLPEDVRVLAASDVAEGWHARYAASGKTYRFRLRRGDVLPPWEGLREVLHRGPLDLGAMRDAARRLEGRRDFAPFSVTGSPVESSVRTLAALTVEERGPLVVVTAIGDGFLRGMVRRLVGTLLDVGSGRTAPRDAPHRPGATAPARGLTLERVLYPPEGLPGDRIEDSGGRAAADTP